MLYNVAHAIVPASEAPEPYTIEYHNLHDAGDIDTFDDLGEALALLACNGNDTHSVVTYTRNPNYINDQADRVTYSCHL